MVITYKWLNVKCMEDLDGNVNLIQQRTKMKDIPKQYIRWIHGEHS